MRTVVLTSPSADARSRRALSRALERWPATVEDVAQAELNDRLHRAAAEADVDWIVVADPDAVLQADAFGSLRRLLAGDVAAVGGRAVIGESQRLGAMFGPARSGPNPFTLVTLAGHQADRELAGLTRGPVDVPQRGVVIVAADFIRTLSGVAFDPDLLHVDVGAYARAAGRTVLCEPSLTFEIDEDSRALRSRLGDLRRYANVAPWQADKMHRDPPRLRALFVEREVRIAGAYRGFMRRPFPPVDVLAVASGELNVARAQRGAAALAGGGSIRVCDAQNGDAVREALTRTSDRCLLVADALSFPSRELLESLVERLERNTHTALAIESVRPPYGAALFHCGRIINGAALRGATVRDVVAAALEDLPLRRLFAVTVEPGPPRVVPVTAAPRTLDAIFVAASKPTVTHQTVQALLGEPVNGATFAVFPAGAATTERLVAVHTGVQLIPDASDVQLAVGLNRALGATRSDSVAIVRDDVQIPHGFLMRLQAAFERIPRLGAVVPRVGGSNRPEALPEQGYQNSMEMQGAFDRRAELYAREAMLVDVATTPVIMISREALDVAGGFDETFGFTRLGVEDFTRRLRTANFLVACCEDAYAHLFAFEEAASYVGNLDDSAFLRAAYEKRWSNRADFDPKRDRVPLRSEAPPAPSRPAGLRVLLPLGTDSEWTRARPLLVDLVAAFRAHDPVEVAIGLDGTFGLQTALAAIRELLLASNIAMEETLNISIDFVSNIGYWRDSDERPMARVEGLDRDELAELPAFGSAVSLRALLLGIRT